MSRSRKDSWLRDELILALDLYIKAGRSPADNSVKKLSDFLRSLPIERDLSDNPQFRNQNAVKLKILNFVAIDPRTEATGMSRHGRKDKEVWNEFSGNPDTLAKTAAAIESNSKLIKNDLTQIKEEAIEAPEGRILGRTHQMRERNPQLVKAKKRQSMKQNGFLACEVCGFDFQKTYGDRGNGFIECHHIVPLSELRPNTKTTIDQLSLLCSNCHRMIHRRAPWLTNGELEIVLRKSEY